MQMSVGPAVLHIVALLKMAADVGALSAPSRPVPPVLVHPVQCAASLVHVAVSPLQCPPAPVTKLLARAKVKSRTAFEVATTVTPSERLYCLLACNTQSICPSPTLPVTLALRMLFCGSTMSALNVPIAAPGLLPSELQTASAPEMPPRFALGKPLVRNV